MTPTGEERRRAGHRLVRAAVGRAEAHAALRALGCLRLPGRGARHAARRAPSHRHRRGRRPARSPRVLRRADARARLRARGGGRGPQVPGDEGTRAHRQRSAPAAVRALPVAVVLVPRPHGCGPAHGARVHGRHRTRDGSESAPVVHSVVSDVRVRCDRARVHPTAARRSGRDRRRCGHRVRAVAGARVVPVIACTAGGTRRVVGVRRATGARDPRRQRPWVRAAVRRTRRARCRAHRGGGHRVRQGARGLLRGPPRRARQRHARGRRVGRLVGRDRPHDARRPARVPAVRRPPDHSGHRGRRTAHQLAAGVRVIGAHRRGARGRARRHRTAARASPPGRAGHHPVRRT